MTEAKRRAVDLFTQGRNAYKLMKFTEAAEHFRKALAVDPSDGPSQVYLERCEFFKTNPPPEDWDGVFVMKTK